MLAGWLGKGIMYSSMCQATVYEISRLVFYRSHPSSAPGERVLPLTAVFASKCRSHPSSTPLGRVLWLEAIEHSFCETFMVMDNTHVLHVWLYSTYVHLMEGKKGGARAGEDAQVAST
jgi:hypothetical protein